MSEIKQALKAVWSPFHGSLNTIGSAWIEKSRLNQKIQRMRAEIRDHEDKNQEFNTLKLGTTTSFLGQPQRGELSESDWERFNNLSRELSEASATIQEHKTNLPKDETEIKRQSSLFIIGTAKLVSLVSAVIFAQNAVMLCVTAGSLPAFVAGISLLIPALICHDCYFVAKKVENLLTGRAFVQQLANEGKYLFKDVFSAFLGIESTTESDREGDIFDYLTADTVFFHFYKPCFQNERAQTAD